MNIQRMKKTLVALALGGLGMAATGAQANDTRGGNEYGTGTSAVVQLEYATQRDRREAHEEPMFNRDHRDHSGYAHQQSRQFSRQIDARQHWQRDRIEAGMRTGNLTRFEFRELMREQRHIRAMEQQFLADGIIDPREYRRLDRALDRASRNIRSEKHDLQARNHHGYNPWFN